MKTFSLEIVTPTRSLKKDDVTYLRCPGMDGLFGVLSGHRDALIALPGEVVCVCLAAAQEDLLVRAQHMARVDHRLARLAHVPVIRILPDPHPRISLADGPGPGQDDLLVPRLVRLPRPSLPLIHRLRPRRRCDTSTRSVVH